MAEITVPDHLSLEGRATMIADETGRIEQAGNPAARRAHVKAHALAHLRAAFEQANRINQPSEKERLHGQAAVKAKQEAA